MECVGDIKRKEKRNAFFVGVSCVVGFCVIIRQRGSPRCLLAADELHELGVLHLTVFSDLVLHGSQELVDFVGVRLLSQIEQNLKMIPRV